MNKRLIAGLLLLGMVSCSGCGGNSDAGTGPPSPPLPPPPNPDEPVTQIYIIIPNLPEGRNFTLKLSAKEILITSNECGIATCVIPNAVIEDIE